MYGVVTQKKSQCINTSIVCEPKDIQIEYITSLLKPKIN